MADGSVKIIVGMDISKAEKELAKLEDKIEDKEKELDALSESGNDLAETIDKTNNLLDETEKKVDAVNKQYESAKDASKDLAKNEKELLSVRRKIAETKAPLAADTGTRSALEEQMYAADAAYSEAERRVRELRQLVKESRGNTKDSYKDQLTEALEERKVLKAEADRLYKEYEKVNKKIQESQKSLDEMLDTESTLVNTVAEERVQREFATGLGTVLEDAKAQQKELSAEAAKLSKEYEKTVKKVEETKKSLVEMKKQYGEAAQQIERARPGEALANSFETARKSLAKFLKYSLGIRSVYILFQRLKSWVKGTFDQYVQYDDELRHNIDLLDATKRATRAAIGSGLANIFSAILPIIQSVANWTLQAANAASRFIAIITGKGSFQKAVVSTNKVAAGLSSVAGSAKEAKKQLMGFDELNILSGNDSGGGGSAGDGIEMVEEAIDALDGHFLSNFALSVKDVLFSWKDLNPEQIAEKFVAGLGSVLGAALGIALGLGPGGVILMTLAGLTLGLIASSLIFDHDGKLSRTEILNMLGLALAGLVGGLIGFQIGGIKGALLGAVIGVSLTLLVTALSINQSRQNFDDTEFGKQVSALKAEIQETLQADADLRIRINSITGEIDENTLADLGAAQSLLDQIFTLGGKENKTAEELELLKQQVEAFNSLGLGDIQIQFDDTTGHIVSTREEVQGLLDDLMRQYQLEAMKEAYVESFKAQYESTENVKKATGEATQATSDYEAALQRLTKAQEDYNREYDIFYNQSYGFGDRSGLSAAEDALKDANDAVKAAKENADGAKEALENAIETAELASEKVDTIGKALADGYSEGIKENRDKSADEARIMAEKTLDAISTTLDAHSPSRKTAEQGKNAVDGFKNEIEAGTPSVVGAAKSMMEQVIREYADGVKRLLRVMNFTWSIPRPKIPQIGWQVQNLRLGNQQLGIPQFFVNWYARGGIIDRASLIGVGEAGKEAVVPLERNTEWMQMVADGLMQRLEQAHFADQLAAAFASTPRPAMASGSIVPPNAISNGYSSGTNDSMLSEIRALRNEIAVLASQPIQVNSKLYMDRREVGSGTTEFQRQQARIGGY